MIDESEEGKGKVTREEAAVEERQGSGARVQGSVRRRLPTQFLLPIVWRKQR